MRLAWRHSSPFALEVGSYIRGHEIKHLVGLRGAGELVYDARAPDGSDVSIVVSTVPSAQRQERARFRRLIPLRTAVDHPGMLRVTGHGEHAGAPFLITHPYPSRTLADLPDGHGIPAARMLPMIASAAEALDLYNSLGMIHQDLTAESLLYDGERLILDGVGLSTPGPDLVWGGVMRDFRFVTPEELRGEPLGAAGNVYAFAGVLVHALTGSPPYEGSQASLVYAHLAGPPPRLSERVPELGRAIDEVLAWGMHKDPLRRPPSATALLYAAADTLNVPMPHSHSVVSGEPDRGRGGDGVRNGSGAPGRKFARGRPGAASGSGARNGRGAPAISRAPAGSGARAVSRALTGAVAWAEGVVRGSGARDRSAPVVVPWRRWLTVASISVAVAAGGFIVGSIADPFGDDPQVASEQPSEARLIGRLDELRGELRTQLAAARTPQDQAAAARELASAYGDAAQALPPNRVAAAAGTAADAYGDLAAAAETDDASGYSDAADAVAGAEARLTVVTRH